MTTLHTSIRLTGSLQDIPAPGTVRIPVEKKHKTVVRKKQIVARGQVIAESVASGAYGTGFVHATIDGAVVDILPDAIVLGPIPAPKEGEAPAVPEPVAPVSLDGLMDDDLVRRLLELGIDTAKFHPSRTLIINGLNPEPGVIVSEQLLQDAKATLEKGVQVLERAVRPGTVKLVVSRRMSIQLYGCSTIVASDVYPKTIDPLVVMTAMKAEHPDNVDVISVSDLYRVGRVAETGLPLVEAVLAVDGSVLRVPTGMAVQDVLAAARVTLPAEYKIAFDGPMRGTAFFDLSAGVPENCTALTIVPAGRYPEVGGGACHNCGECVLACPARIQPGMLSRLSEFGMYEDARGNHVEACLECGMCTFVCPANRPVLQYLKLARQQLVQQDEMLSTCRLQD